MKQHTPLRNAIALSISALILSAAFPACQQSADKPLPNSADSADVKPAVTPMQPDEENGVDLGRWYDMTREEFKNLYTTFTKTEPPIVRNYGICDSITCHFSSTAKSAKPEILICDLNGVYLVTDAFRLLGIEIGQIGRTDEAWITVASLDKRFSALQYKNTGKHADRTVQILLQFNREKPKD